MSTSRRLIEEYFPVKEVSDESRTEKSGRAPIFELHFWWTRKPLAASRAVVLGSILPPLVNPEKFSRMLGLNKERRMYEYDVSTSALAVLTEYSQRELGVKKPKILDPMAGGGSIPFEAARMGLEATAIEYNPVAYLLLKATLEYPQRYGTKLAEDIEKWGQWVIENTEREVGHLYPKHDGKNVSAYLWVWTVECPRCSFPTPLTLHWWLSTARGRKIIAIPSIHGNDFSVEISELGPRQQPPEGTMKRGKALCMKCGASIDSPHIKKELKKRKRKLLVTAVLSKERGKTFEKPTNADYTALEKAESLLSDMWESLHGKGLIPDEPMATYELFRATSYGFRNWNELFSTRQLLTSLTFMKWVIKSREEIFEQETLKRRSKAEAREYTKAIITYLALALDKLADFNSTCTYWYVPGEKISPSFTFRGPRVIWNHAEINPFAKASGSWASILKRIVASAGFSADKVHTPSTVMFGSALHLPFENEKFHIVVTDPPYYDDVPYGELSDFFYVWLKRSVGEFYPEAFSTPTVPKDEEIDYSPGRHGSKEASRSFFEASLRKAFVEMKRVLKADGLLTLFFAHSSTEAWENVIHALMDSGFQVTMTWPVHTEKPGSVIQRGKASMQSSIIIVARKRQGQSTAYIEDIRGEIEDRLRQRFDRLWSYGLRGGDLAVAAIGPVLELVTKYSEIKSYSGQLSVGRLIDEVQATTAKYALEKLIGKPVTALDEATAFYLYARIYHGLEPLVFDDAKKIAQPFGASIPDLESRLGLIAVDRGKGKTARIRLLTAEQRQLRPSAPEVNCLMDAVHLAELAFKTGGSAGLTALKRRLTGVSIQDVKKIIDVLYTALPNGDPEKKLLAPLAGYEIGPEEGQRSLKEYW